MNRRRFQICFWLALAVTVLPWAVGPAQGGPGGGTYYANSPAGGGTGTAIRKFVDSLPGLGSGAANNLGQYIPVADPDTTSFPGSDYYVIGLRDYTMKMHSDLPKATRLRGYYQINNGTALGAGTDHTSQYLGTLIVATRDKPVRINFTNNLATDASGNLFIPVDTTVMGAGTGPLGGVELYPENRATVHLHGGLTPWISDGTPHQWITPAGQVTSYPKGVSQQNVPDMWFDASGNVVTACSGQTTCATPGATTNPGAGAATFYYTNQQSSRLVFYHDHSYGITRLNVYAGEAAGYIIRDASEQALITAGIIPSAEVPLVIQDKTFVPQNVAVQDTSWDTTTWGQGGDLWFPHVYEKNQDPTQPDGLNPTGRWDYGPWVWPPSPVTNPTLPQLSYVPEGFMDTPIVNGTAYPYMTVDRKAYRFRILNACNDRTLNLQLYYADVSGNLDPSGNYTEVKMVSAPDARVGGIPDQTLVGPRILQIGTEAGFLPAPVVLNDAAAAVAVVNPKPLYLGNPDAFGNWRQYNLLLMPAERADVIIDFSQVPVGNDASRTLILYNDAPAAYPGGDPRYDYYTGNPDQTSSGGAPSTLSGMGPNIRTIMQFRLSGLAPSPIYDEASLNAALPVAYAAQQHPSIVPASTYAKLTDTGMTVGGTAVPFHGKSINEGFDAAYGRISAVLGTEANALSTPLAYADPVTETVLPGEIQLWKITHNGIDSHPIHFHLFDVQVVNRIGWDGSIVPPDPNELGWKETVRMNPFQETVVALKPVAPNVPFVLPDNIRPLDPTAPLDVTSTNFSNPATINRLTNFGHEYAWHCHILGHEEFDLMRPLVLNTDNLLYANFTTGLTGLYQWDGTTLTQITPTNATSMVASNSLLYADFAGDGLYKWDGTAWTKLTGSHPTSMVASNSLLYADFAGDGLYKLDGTAWSLLTKDHPTSMVASNSLLYADFATYGLYGWNGTAWSLLTKDHPTSMVASNSLLYADFATYGLYGWNGTAWSLLTKDHPTSMVASNSLLYADFAGDGLYSWNGTAWSLLTKDHPTSMMAANSWLYADFAGAGLYKWDGATWTKLTGSHPALMATSGAIPFADFSGDALYAWDVNAWTKITSAHPTNMVAGF